jgi:hypothetical protein
VPAQHAADDRSKNHPESKPNTGHDDDTSSHVTTSLCTITYLGERGPSPKRSQGARQAHVCGRGNVVQWRMHFSDEALEEGVSV